MEADQSISTRWPRESGWVFLLFLNHCMTLIFKYVNGIKGEKKVNLGNIQQIKTKKKKGKYSREKNIILLLNGLVEA